MTQQPQTPSELVQALGMGVVGYLKTGEDGWTSYMLIFPQDAVRLMPGAQDANNFAIRLAVILPEGQLLNLERARSSPKTHFKMYARYKHA